MWPTSTELLEQARMLAQNAGKGLVIFLAFWILSKVLERVITRFVDEDRSNSELFELLARTASIGLQIFGLVTALGTAGVNVSALVAGLGLTGFALGFAFRDVLSNLLAGVLLLLYRPFRRGDRIAVTGLEGEVTHIDLRYTRLVNEGKIILIPNSNLFTNPIIVHPRTGPVDTPEPVEAL